MSHFYYLLRTATQAIEAHGRHIADYINIPFEGHPPEHLRLAIAAGSLAGEHNTERQARARLAFQGIWTEIGPFFRSSIYQSTHVPKLSAYGVTLFDPLAVRRGNSPPPRYELTASYNNLLSDNIRRYVNEWITKRQSDLNALSVAVRVYRLDDPDLGGRLTEHNYVAFAIANGCFQYITALVGYLASETSLQLLTEKMYDQTFLPVGHRELAAVLADPHSVRYAMQGRVEPNSPKMATNYVVRSELQLIATKFVRNIAYSAVLVFAARGEARRVDEFIRTMAALPPQLLYMRLNPVVLRALAFLVGAQFGQTAVVDRMRDQITLDKAEMHRTAERVGWARAVQAVAELPYQGGRADQISRMEFANDLPFVVAPDGSVLYVAYYARALGLSEGTTGQR
ncbi:hypothetical protein IWQ60_004267 [Tieghemiomyces parasiticus]|uniref:Uncharacterized protein n=1 Tax=Tieghemiomyces parasiticus TaxID=78921 RepID=A0A9W8DU22_9FUNG|nr:hypothetical protein IWQ60_004267 [Tieghemiomyces parasiticus]